MRNKTNTTVLVATVALLALADAASAYYSPRLGRFLSRDPVDEPGAVLVRQVARSATSFIPRDSIDENGYTGMQNNAVSWFDPDGGQATTLPAPTRPSSGLPTTPVKDACPGVSSPPKASECLKCNGRPPGPICNSHTAGYTYGGFSTRCVCNCMPSNPKNDKIRSCLACMKEAGVGDWSAHMQCYKAAGASKRETGIEICNKCSKCAVGQPAKLICCIVNHPPPPLPPIYVPIG